MSLLKNIVIIIIAISWIPTLNADEIDTTVRIYTENYGQFNYSLQGREYEHNEEFIGGASADLIKRVMKESNLPYTMKLRAWSVGYERTINKPYNGIFSTTRTESRENLFYWIGPIAQNNSVLYVKKGSSLTINSLADLKGLRVGGYKSDANTQYLLDQGIPVIEAAVDSINPNKLALDVIDVWIAAEANARQTAEKAGYPDIEKAFIVISRDMYLAMNKDTPPAVLAKIEAAYKKITAGNN